MTITDNKPYKVLIPTAGTGIRLGNLTKYINKSLINIANKPAISYIIDMFPENCEFVIALGYKADLVKQFLLLAYPDKKFHFAVVDKFAGDGSGLGLSILACKDFLQEPFVFCSCDTIVTEKIPYPDKNIAAYSIRSDVSQYRTIILNNGKVKKIFEKNSFDSCDETGKNAYIGLCCIKDYELFWKTLTDGKKDAIFLGETYSLLEFVKNNSLYAKEFTWFDTGNIDELIKTQKYFKKADLPNILPKNGEAIWFVNNNVIKYSCDKTFISQRIQRCKYLQGYIPKVKSSTENMYTYEKEEGYVLSKIQNISLFEKLLTVSKEFWREYSLDNEQKTAFNAACKSFYYTKTLERINLYYQNFGITDAETIINGFKYPKLSDILEKTDWNNILQGLPGRFHGDFHFENIIYNPKNDKFTFLDWRQNFGNILEYGDIYYDLAKLLHGLIICHELIVQNKYNISVDKNVIAYSFERKKILTECEDYFYQWLAENNYSVDKVKTLTALIYLNIAALHHYPYCHLLYFLGKTMLFKSCK